MKKNRQQSEPKHLKQQPPKALSSSRVKFRHRDRGLNAGRVRAG
jgi:hypothetical protein